MDKCYHHPSKDAVAQCKLCKKAICKDCREMYGVTSGEYADEALCYDCTSGFVAQNVQEVDAFKKKVKGERIRMIVGASISVAIMLVLIVVTAEDVFHGADIGQTIGMIFGFIIALIFIAGLGASFGTIFGPIYRFTKDSENAQIFLSVLMIIAFVPIIVGLFVIGLPISLYRFFKRKKQIRQAEDIIANDTLALEQMKNYFEYTQFIEKLGSNINLSKLTDQGGELFNNTYAKTVIGKGEKEAKDELRQNVIQIAEDGEIISGFDKKKEKKK